MACLRIIWGACLAMKGRNAHDNTVIDPRLRGLVRRKAQISSISVGNLLAARRLQYPRDRNPLCNTIIDVMTKKAIDNSAMHSSSVVSNRQLRRLRNHTEMMVFAMVQTSSDTEVVGDLLSNVLANQYGREMPLHIAMTSKSVLILYVHAVFGIVWHTVTILEPLQTVASRNCHGFRVWIWQVIDLILLNGARRRI